MSKEPYILYVDGMEIPVTPAKIKSKIGSKNDFYELLNGETYTVKKDKKPVEYTFSFYAFSHPHENVNTFTPQQQIIDKLEELKKELKDFEFVILRTPSDPSLRNTTCKHMTLEDYDIDEDSKYGTNIIITLNLKEFMPLKTVELKKEESTSKGAGSSGKTGEERMTVNELVKVAQSMPRNLMTTEEIDKYIDEQADIMVRRRPKEKAKTIGVEAVTYGK